MKPAEIPVVYEQRTSADIERINKWLTVWRYLHGFLSHAGIEAAFRAHPEWRDA